MHLEAAPDRRAGYVGSPPRPPPSRTDGTGRTTRPARDIRVAAGMGRPQESSAGASRMKAVILAAGEGARMGPFTASVPKVMIPVGNRPLLEYVVQALADNGVRDLIFIVGYRREGVPAHLPRRQWLWGPKPHLPPTKQHWRAHPHWGGPGDPREPLPLPHRGHTV